jgi:hypothetical protein
MTWPAEITKGGNDDIIISSWLGQECSRYDDKFLDTSFA